MSDESTELMISILRKLRDLATENEDPEFPSSRGHDVSKQIDSLEKMIIADLDDRSKNLMALRDSLEIKGLLKK